MEYVADFETCKYNKKQRVWLWAIRPATDKIDENVQIGTNIKTFFSQLGDLDQKRPVVFFHNLKYDSSYLLDYLLKNGYEFTTKHPHELLENELTTNSNVEGEMYEVAININNKIIRIKDSMKLFNASEAALAKSYGLPTEKGEIDYTKPRGEDYIPTQEEINYIKNDVFIISYILFHFRQQGFEKYTASASAFNEFVKMAYPRKTIRYSYNAFYEHHQIATEDAQKVRPAYLGGYCYLNPLFKGKTLTDGIVIDVNTMYGFIMKNRNMPYGSPVHTDGAPFYSAKYNLSISRVYIDAKLKKNGLPTIQNRKVFLSNYGYSDYITDTHGVIEITLTDVDINLIFENYDINYFEYQESWSFKSKKGGLFTKYIDRFYDMKRKAREEQNETKAQIAKLFLNSLYGKFGTNPNIITTKPTVENEIIKFKVSEHKTQESVYVPLSIFITAFAREYLIKTIMANRDRFIYCDTDSIHLKGTEPPKMAKIDPFELGAWKIEYQFVKARYLNPKQYILEDKDGDSKIRCAGLSVKSQKLIKFDDFNYNATFNTLISRNANGGSELVTRTFQLK